MPETARSDCRARCRAFLDARARTGRAPILPLLDEIAAHLDERRRAALFERLAVTGSQVWMTGTDAGLFASAAGQRLRVEGGRVA